MFRRSACRRVLTSYLTDVEGSLDYFNKFLGISRVLYQDPNGKLQLRDGTQFVFGGDAFDKGDGDLEICEKLVDLKERYPDRCTFILGNRDVNKTTFTSHFTENVLSRGPEGITIPYYAGNVPTYAQFLHQHSQSLQHGVVALMKYRLQFTMGCQTTFDMRRRELQRQQPSRAVSDMDVTESFLRSVEPGGIVRRFIQHGELIKVIDGVAFVHGAIVPENVGFVPNDSLLDVTHNSPPDGRFMVKEGRSLQDWCDELNGFARRSIAKWIQQPQVDEHGVRGAHAIGAYGHRKSIHSRTVMVMTYMESHQPQFVDFGVVQYLNAHGVFRVCCGHQPSGDTPFVINQPGLCVINADSSYCDLKSASGRGEAIAEVLLDGDAGTAIIHGKRHDGMPFEFDADDDIIGRPVGDGWWSKAALEGGDRVLLHRTTDKFFSNEYRIVDKSEAERLVAHQAGQHTAVAGDAHESFTRADLVPPRVLKSKRTPLPLTDCEGPK